MAEQSSRTVIRANGMGTRIELTGHIGMYLTARSHGVRQTETSDLVGNIS